VIEWEIARLFAISFKGSQLAARIKVTEEWQAVNGSCKQFSPEYAKLLASSGQTSKDTCTKKQVLNTMAHL